MKWLLLILPLNLFGQWSQIENFPGVLTSISFTPEMMTTHQNGLIRINGDTLVQVPTWLNNECGLLSAVIYLGELTYNSSSPTAQHIIKGQDTLLSVPYTSTRHRGGCMQAVNDTLYVSFGYGNQSEDSQDTTNLRGKIVRLYPPAFNPEIVCLGLRNPWKFFVNDSIWIADVGGDYYEEINVSYGGENFGWPYFEGDTMLIDTFGFTPPVFSYQHLEGQSSVIGGVVLDKFYYFTDFYSTQGYRISDHVEPFEYPIDIVSFATDYSKLYAGSWDGRVYRLDSPLSIDTVQVGYTPEELDYWRLELLERYGDVWIGLDGRAHLKAPKITGYYYSIVEQKWFFIEK